MTRPALLPHLLENAAETTPDAVAVRCGDHQLSFAELLTRSSQFARAVREAGVQAGQPIGVHMAKSLDAVVAIHGIQRAGAISAPIDPMAPPAAVQRISAALGLGAMVLDRARATRLDGLELAPVIVGAAPAEPSVKARRLGWDTIAEHEGAPLADIGDQDPAYMITTSGSTGVPKAIVHSHASGLSYARLAADCYELRPDDRLANVAPFHFDQSTFELYASLVFGSTVVLVPDPLLKFPADLSALLERERITIWYSVPTILVHLLKRGALDRRDLSALRWVLFGGEIFPSAALGDLMDKFPSARFSNIYGPAEVNQCSHHHLTESPGPDESIPIGAPWPETSLRLIDDEDRLVSGPGRGKLDVMAPTVMSGYWRSPELSAAAISTETRRDGTIERWYHTGDIVERDVGGLLHFLGRGDRQTKIRGNRVELEAVEAAVSDAPGVMRCAAVATSRADETVLVAVVEGEPDLDPAAVLAAARLVLPPYAVPDNVVVMDSLPRTTSGKVDARAAAAAADKHLMGAQQ